MFFARKTVAGREPELPAPTRVGSEIITQASDSTGCGGTGSLLVNRNLKVPKDRHAMGDRKWGQAFSRATVAPTPGTRGSHGVEQFTTGGPLKAPMASTHLSQ